MTAFVFNLHDPSAQEVVEACASKLEEIENTKVILRTSSAGPLHADGTLEVRGAGKTERFVVEAKRRIDPGALPAVIANLKHAAQQARKRPFLAAGYINTIAATRLKAENVAYADAAGNAYLSLPSFHVWREGLGPVRKPEPESRAFQATGARLVALLLVQTPDINWNVRQLSSEAGVSLGSVSRIMRDLWRAGFIELAAKEKRVLRNGVDLFQRWELSYLERLRPRLGPRSYRLADGAPLDVLLERVARMNGETILIGGELAAAIKLPGLRPGSATLHVKSLTPGSQVPNRLQLIRAEDGNIDLVEHFGSGNAWLWPDASKVPFAHPVLVHSEMIRHSHDGRVREAAQQLFDECIASRLAR